MVANKAQTSAEESVSGETINLVKALLIGMQNRAQASLAQALFCGSNKGMNKIWKVVSLQINRKENGMRLANILHEGTLRGMKGNFYV